MSRASLSVETKAYNCPQDALQFVDDFNILVFHAMCSDEIDKFAEVSLGLEDHPPFGRFDKLAVEMQGHGAIEGSAAISACCLLRCSPYARWFACNQIFRPNAHAFREHHF